METQHQLLSELRKRDEPAMSAAAIADRVDLSVKTVNSHLDTLVEEDRVQTTQIGNATAYYVQYEDLPQWDKADHLCSRCGREVYTTYDFAKIDLQTYFRESHEDEGIPEFRILCRFCYTDLFKWLDHRDDIGEYPFVHSWDLRDKQLSEVREDPSVMTAPEPPEAETDNWQKLYAHLLTEFEKDQWVDGYEIYESADFLTEKETRDALTHLLNVGFVDGDLYEFRLAK